MSLGWFKDEFWAIKHCLDDAAIMPVFMFAHDFVMVRVLQNYQFVCLSIYEIATFIQQLWPLVGSQAELGGLEQMN